MKGLLNAIENSDINSVIEYLQEKALENINEKINDQNIHDKTLLELAVTCNSPSIVGLLLTNGARIEKGLLGNYTSPPALYSYNPSIRDEEERFKDIQKMIAVTIAADEFFITVEPSKIPILEEKFVEIFNYRMIANLAVDEVDEIQEGAILNLLEGISPTPFSALLEQTNMQGWPKEPEEIKQKTLDFYKDLYNNIAIIEDEKDNCPKINDLITKYEQDVLSSDDKDLLISFLKMNTGYYTKNQIGKLTSLTFSPSSITQDREKICQLISALKEVGYKGAIEGSKIEYDGVSYEELLTKERQEYQITTDNIWSMRNEADFKYPAELERFLLQRIAELDNILLAGRDARQSFVDDSVIN